MVSCEEMCAWCLESWIAYIRDDDDDDLCFASFYDDGKSLCNMI